MIFTGNFMHEQNKGPRRLWQLGHRAHQNGEHGDARTELEADAQAHGIITEGEPDKGLKDLLESVVRRKKP